MINTHEHARKIFRSIAKQYETYEDIKEHIRDLHSTGELSDNEYNYILQEWDNMLIEFGL